MQSLISHKNKIIVSLCLTLITGAVFGIAVTYDFLNYDDNDYVTENHQVQAGLSMRGVFWAFTTTLQGHWHPVTLLSHMLDCQLFGLNPAGHHFTSILFHILNTILLFIVLERMTKALWPSALVAALFALHPLHVEPVAWIASRKDVLSTFFMLMTLWVYVYYAASPTTGKYLLMLALFALGLLAKSMLVTLPFVLWLLDYWPLGRWTAAFSDGRRHRLLSRMWNARLFWEKLPFLSLSLIVGMITFLARQSGSRGRVSSLPPFEVSFTERLTNAVNGYAVYVWKMFWPTNLNIVYRETAPASLWEYLLSFCLLIGVSFLCLKYIKRHPYLMVGWLWFLVMLVPVAGIIKKGPRLGADRYTYVSMVGLFIMLTWGLFEFRAGRFRGKSVSIILMVLFLVMCAMLSYKQIGYWKDSTTVFSHAITVNPDNVVARLNLGLALYKADNKDEALEHLNRAVQLEPRNRKARNGLGYVLRDMGQYRKAIDHLSEAVRIDPKYSKAHVDLAICLAQTGDLDRARDHFIEAIKLNTDYLDACYQYGYALGHQKKYRESFEQLKKTLNIDPEYTNQYDLGRGIKSYEDGRLPEAERLLKEVIRRFPKKSEAFLYLGLIASSKGQLDSAISYLRSAIKADPRYTEAHVNLGIALAQKEEYAEAGKAFSDALKINPNHVKAHYNYAASLYLQHQDKEAVEELAKALEIDPNFKEARDLLNTLQTANNE